MKSFCNGFQPRRRALVCLFAVTAIGAGLASAATAVQAQAYPSKNITMIVPFPAGGTTDILARIMGQCIGDDLGQTVVIDNRAGAGGNIGSQAVARATADGYTLLMGTVGTHAINASLYKKMPYDHVKDFVPLSRIAMVPNLLVAHPSQKFNTVQEMIAFAKANPGKINYASSGNGTSIHLSGAMFETMAGVDMTHIPYKGSAPAVSDLLGGQVAIMFDNMPSALQHVKAGKLKAIAVTSAKRSPELPNVPTVAEAGIPGYEATSWFGMLAPAGTPPDVVSKLNSTIVKCLNDPAIRKKISDQGAEPHPEKSAEFAQFIKTETEKWGKVVKASGASID